MQGSEMGLGFVVNGVAISEEGTLLGKLGASAGDALVLTKPLGTGVLFAGHMQLDANGRDIAAAVEMMLMSNAVAAELALAHGASACTDVTGFGLLGHLLEMLSADQGARLEWNQVPLLPGTMELNRAGIVSTMYRANVSSHSRYVQTSSSVEDADLQLMFDPQTSGGLLIAVPENQASLLCDSLHRHGYPEARIIGAVTALDKPGAAAVEIHYADD
jgi:selenide,water dikinase